MVSVSKVWGNYPAGTMNHKACVQACLASHHGFFLKDRRSSDAILLHGIPHLNLCCVPLMFDNFLMLLTTPNSVVITVHDTIKMECCIIRKTHRDEENFIIVNFPQHLLSKSHSAVTVGWFDVLSQLQFVLM
jgi:hypothetical protein